MDAIISELLACWLWLDALFMDFPNTGNSETVLMVIGCVESQGI